MIFRSLTFGAALAAAAAIATAGDAPNALPIPEAQAGGIRVHLDVFAHFESAPAIVVAEVDFGRAVDNGSMRLVKDEAETEFAWFPIPGEIGMGRLYWRTKALEPFTDRGRYILEAKAGSWSEEPAGSRTFLETMASTVTRVANPFFDEIDSETGRPVRWTLTGDARLVSDPVRRSSRAVLASAEFEADAYKRGQVVQEIPLKPETEYRLSAWFCIPEQTVNERRHQAVAAELRFLDAEKNRIREDGPTRIFAFYATEGRDTASYLDRWIQLDERATTPPGTRYGSLVLGPMLGFEGKVIFDDVCLHETGPGYPLRIEVSPPIEVGYPFLP